MTKKNRSEKTDNPDRHEFTIIAGFLKNRRISSPDLGVTRPPLTRLRKSLFDFLRPYLDEARFLDLFSGTGSYLFEAVSRGAARAVGVEWEPRLVEAINRQAERFKVDDRLTCRCADVFTCFADFASHGERFDIITMAPPQYQGFIDRALAALRKHPVYLPDSLIICQHDSSETTRINFLDFPVLQRRKYGNTTFTVLTPPGEAPASDRD